MQIDLAGRKAALSSLFPTVSLSRLLISNASGSEQSPWLTVIRVTVGVGKITSQSGTNLADSWG